MKRSILHIILLLWAMLPATTAHSQSYPVQSNVYVVAPYSQTYSDYYADGQQRMFVNILLNDMSQGHLDVVLRFSIKSNNLKLTSKLTGNVQPITIHSGKMYRVEGSELAQYLRVDGMQAEGRLAGEFQKSGKLPEGYYEIKVEVVEYYRRANVSAPSYSTMWIMQPEAPVWTMPQNNAKIDAISPQFMLFGWMMTGNTSMLRNIKYEFSIYEKPASMSADVVVKTSTPIYSEKLTQQTLVYGPDKPLLELGKVYACRVKVEDGDGLVSFKNDGYSSTLVFKYGEECDPPTQVTITDITKKGATVNWVSDQSHSGYDVEVRELSDGKSSDWFTWKIDKRQYNYEIKQLSSDSRYECRVAAVCGQRSNGIRSAYTDPVEFKTYEAGNKKYNCGDLVEASKPTNRVPYPYLEEGDVITANGFVFIIESISKAGGGLFTGQCSWYINLWGVKILCDFKDISINATKELIGGQIVACHDKAQVKAFTRLQSAAYMPAGTQVPTSFKADKIMTMTETVDSVRIVDGETLIYVAGQNPVKVSATDNVFVQSADGNYYAVADGKVYPKPSNLDKDGNRTLSYNQLITATFGYDDNFGRHAGVDAYSDEKKAFAAQYSQYQLHSNDAYATWIAKSQTAIPIARVTVSGGDRTALQFRNGGQAVAVNNAADADALYLPLTADGQYDAYYTTQDTHGADLEVMAGQLNVVSYPQQNINVCLVEVNGASYPRTANELSNYLNDVFGQAVFGVNLTKASIEVEKFNGTLSAKESGALTAYNSDMKKLIKKVKRLPDYNSNTYYIMVVAKSDNSSLAGFMPVNSNFGFVFADACNSIDMLNRTIAHELAHGAFHLWHTFSSSNTYTAPQGTTNNLMDYNGTADELYKYQWDYIHNPQQGIVRWLVEDDESEAVVYTDECWENRDNWDKVQSAKLAYLVNNKKELQYESSCMYEYSPGSFRYYYKLVDGSYFVADKVWSYEGYEEKYYRYDKGANLWRRVSMSDYTDWCLKCELDEVGERILKDVILSDEAKALAKIGVGVIAVAGAVYTGGASLSIGKALFASFSVTSGTMTTALGTTELVLALKDENELIEKLPSGYLDATIGLTVEALNGDTKTTKIVRCVVDATENAITISIPATGGAQVISNAVNISNIVLDGVEIYNVENEK